MKPVPSFAVRDTDVARDDLLRLFDFLVERAETADDFELAQRAVDAVVTAIEDQMGRTPFSFRKAGSSPFLRELVIPFGHADCVALYEIQDAAAINVLAVRHQREDDYH